jgi:hypothetical protein
MYSTDREVQAAAEASSGPAPGPADNRDEWISGGDATQIGAVKVISSLGVHRPGSQDATM